MHMMGDLLDLDCNNLPTGPLDNDEVNHNLTVPSSLAVANLAPSGEHTTAFTLVSWALVHILACLGTTDRGPFLVVPVVPVALLEDAWFDLDSLLRGLLLLLLLLLPPLPPTPLHVCAAIAPSTAPPPT